MRRFTRNYKYFLPYLSRKFMNIPQQHRLFHKSSYLFGEIVSFKLSDIGEGISEVTVKEWFIKEGDSVNQFDSICEVQSDKASVTITSRYDGIVRKIYYDVEDTAKVGLPLVDIELNEEDSSRHDGQVDQIQDQYAAPIEDAGNFDNLNTTKALATPAVRRIAAEHDIRLSEVQGTGRDGRVLKEDVLNFMNLQKSKAEAQIGKDIEQTVKPGEVDKALLKAEKHQVVKTAIHERKTVTEDRIEIIKGYKKAMTKMMSKTCSVPTFLYSDEVDVTELVSLRKILKKRSEEHGIKFSYMPFFIKAASLALKHYPELNSSVDESCKTMIYKAAHNIGIAMDTQKGLVVPNIKNVQNLTLLEIAAQLNHLQQLGAKGQLGTSELSNGTFTLSNIGVIGGTYAKPVLLLPEVAIGAIGRIQAVPKFDANESLVKRNILQVSWTADHRIIDGATVGRFSNMWKNFLENPVTMLLEMR